MSIDVNKAYRRKKAIIKLPQILWLVHSTPLLGLSFGRVQVIDGPGESTFVYISTFDQFFLEETLTEYEIIEKSKMSIYP